MFPLFRDPPALDGDAAQDGAAAASSSSSPRTIREGDLVIVYESPQSMKAVTIDGAKGQFQNRFGNFPHKVGPAASSCTPSCMHQPKVPAFMVYLLAWRCFQTLGALSCRKPMRTPMRCAHHLPVSYP